MNKILRAVILSVFLGMFVSSESFARDWSGVSFRSFYKYGISVSTQSQKANYLTPKDYSLSLSYNLSSLARLSASYTALREGTTTRGNTYEGAFNLFVPGWNFTPTVGVKYRMFKINSGSSYNGYTADFYDVAATAGLDWTASNGFNFGVGYNYSLRQTNVDSVYLNLGFYF